LFAAGYEIRTKESWDRMMEEFDRVVGLEFLQGLHINDSKGDLGCKTDRHENLGKGKIGLEPFKFIMVRRRIVISVIIINLYV
jgi:endonuclease IV